MRVKVPCVEQVPTRDGDAVAVGLELQLARGAGDTVERYGGKSFFDSNDFAGVQQVQKDTEAYYILGFGRRTRRGTGDIASDGKAESQDASWSKAGLLCSADFKHQKNEDGASSEEQLQSGLPATDVALYCRRFTSGCRE